MGRRRTIVLGVLCSEVRTTVELPEAAAEWYAVVDRAARVFGVVFDAVDAVAFGAVFAGDAAVLAATGLCTARFFLVAAFFFAVEGVAVLSGAPANKSTPGSMSAVK